eukprot:1831071-Amphidinium_carterae.1
MPSHFNGNLTQHIAYSLHFIDHSIRSFFTLPCEELRGTVQSSLAEFPPRVRPKQIACAVWSRAQRETCGYAVVTPKWCVSGRISWLVPRCTVCQISIEAVVATN